MRTSTKERLKESVPSMNLGILFGVIIASALFQPLEVLREPEKAWLAQAGVAPVDEAL